MFKIIMVILTALTLATAGVFTAVASGAVPDATMLKVEQAVQQVFAPQSADGPAQAAQAVQATPDGSVYTGNFQIVCGAIESAPQPLLEKLAAQYQVPYQDLVNQICSGVFPGTLPPNVTIVPWSPQAWPTDIATLWPTWFPTVFPTGLPSEFPTGVWTQVPYPTPYPCGGPYAQEKADAIAQQLSTLTGTTVTSQEILDLLCKGYGGPEIVAAYLISHEKGVLVADVLAMRDSGKTWTEILEFYGLVQLPSRPARPTITIPPNVTPPPGFPNPGGSWPRPRVRP
jgi:uncharacterized protein (DUF433 family)